MKKGFLVLGFVFVCLAARAEKASTVIAPDTENGSGCDIASVGIDKDVFLAYFSKLKAAAATKDANKMSELVLYPMIGAARKKIVTPAQLKKEFSDLFSPEILNSISTQEVDKLFCNYNGIMIGHGEVWIGAKKDKVGIMSINPGAIAAKTVAAPAVKKEVKAEAEVPEDFKKMFAQFSLAIESKDALKASELSEFPLINAVYLQKDKVSKKEFESNLGGHTYGFCKDQMPEKNTRGTGWVLNCGGNLFYFGQIKGQWKYLGYENINE